MVKSKISAWFAIWMALLTVAFYLWPEEHMVWWGAIGLSSVAGVVVGVAVHKPSRRWPWLLLAAALACFGAGDFLYNLLTDVFGLENPFPSVNDVLYLAMYPLLAGGLTVLAALSLTGQVQVWQIVALVAVYGAASGFFGPAFDGLVPTLVDEDELVQANALDQFVRPAALQMAGRRWAASSSPWAAAGWPSRWTPRRSRSRRRACC